MGDLTPRARQALEEAEVVFAEDTRTAKALLHHLDLRKEVKSYHKDNETEAVNAVLQVLRDGKKTALISEAGMPGISDPGWLLINTLIKEHIPFEVVPGVNAAVHAAVASGLCRDGRYLFAGFLPHKGAEQELLRLKKIPYTIVFYESPHRAEATIKLLLKHFKAPIAVCRELTKLHEEILWLEKEEDTATITYKGEFCLVVDNSSAEKDDDSEGLNLTALVDELAKQGLGGKAVMSILKAAGVKRNEAYRIANSLNIGS
jgi:16S rRNA (cytidine1402-2'-O)-methyltransferase